MSAPKIDLIHGDCMTAMSEMQENQFDLSIVDPPFGIGKDWKKRNNNRKRYPDTSYDNKEIPDKKYFSELKRVSVNQIIWGYNYYTDFLGSTNNLVFWDKCTNGTFYSAGEIAYTSFKKPLTILKSPWDGYRMGNETGIKKIHPHQKPVSLYRWLLKTYTKVGQKILDTHLGGGAIAIACHDLGFDLTGYEIDKTYFDAAIKRLNEHRSQLQFKDVL